MRNQNLSEPQNILHVHIIRIWQLKHEKEYVAPLVRGYFAEDTTQTCYFHLSAHLKTRLPVYSAIADRKLGGHDCRRRHARRQLIRMNAELRARCFVIQ